MLHLQCTLRATVHPGESFALCTATRKNTPSWGVFCYYIYAQRSLDSRRAWCDEHRQHVDNGECCRIIIDMQKVNQFNVVSFALLIALMMMTVFMSLTALKLERVQEEQRITNKELVELRNDYLILFTTYKATVGEMIHMRLIDCDRGIMPEVHEPARYQEISEHAWRDIA